MSATIRELAEMVEGVVVGDESLVIDGCNPLEECSLGDITFVEKKHQDLSQLPASAVFVANDFDGAGKTVIKVADPRFAFVKVFRHFQGYVEPPPHGIDDRASVHPSATIGPQASIYPFACVGEGTTVGTRCQIHNGASVGRNCRIGDDVIIHANAVLYDGTVIGDRTIIHANSVLGADGFGFRPNPAGHTKIPQLGHVEVGDDVEIGAGVTVDRGTFHATRIGSGTKIDNLVQIAHNCQIGKHNLVVAQVGIGGSCQTGDFVIMAGQVGIVDHVKIGDGVVIGAQSGVAHDIPDGQRFFGSPAIPEYDQKRIIMSWQKLPEMRRDLRAIKKQLGADNKDAA